MEQILIAVLVTMIAVLVIVIAWLLRSDRGHGGTLDLTAAAARGELEWDWPARFPPVREQDASLTAGR